MSRLKEAPPQLLKIVQSAMPKVAIITMNRDARRSSIYNQGPIDASLFARGSSTMTITEEESNHMVSLINEEPEKIQYENTYRTDPDVKFPHDVVKEIMEDILISKLKGVNYDRPSCINLCKTLSQEIKLKIKETVHRYKIISLVTIGQKKEQDVRMGSRCVWDAEWDCYASTYYENEELFAVAITYALFYE